MLKKMVLVSTLMIMFSGMVAPVFALSEDWTAGNFNPPPPYSSTGLDVTNTATSSDYKIMLIPPIHTIDMPGGNRLTMDESGGSTAGMFFRYMNRPFHYEEDCVLTTTVYAPPPGSTGAPGISARYLEGAYNGYFAFVDYRNSSPNYGSLVLAWGGAPVANEPIAGFSNTKDYFLTFRLLEGLLIAWVDEIGGPSGLEARIERPSGAFPFGYAGVFTFPDPFSTNPTSVEFGPWSIVATPEPGSIALMLLSLQSLLLLRRRGPSKRIAG